MGILRNVLCSHKRDLVTYFKIIVLAFIAISCVDSFNISPKPNLVLREPNLKIFMEKKRSSYFGYSLNLRQNSVIVGAPRAQSSLEMQRKVDEPGAVYKCNIITGNCNPYVFDKVGNTNSEFNDYTYDSEKKDYQWLGGTMDGGSKENDKLVVCAPKLLANLGSEYLVHGICYWTRNTIGDVPLEVKKIAPLRLKSKQVRNDGDKKYFYYMFGEQGFSCHLTENSEEILMGAPGVHTWKGSLVRYRVKVQEDLGGLSRRDLDAAKHQIVKRDTLEYISEVPNPETWDQKSDSYFGYALTSAFFEGPSSSKLLYAASAPQADDQNGEVYVFDIITLPYGEYSIKKFHTFHGTQFGEYFGYALLADDFNGDGFPDLAISAPMYRGAQNYEGGAVYIFLNKGNFNFVLQKRITIDTEMPARFGTTLSKLGDLNRDGYADIAIGAPFEGDGVVYVYLGNAIGIQDKPSQILKSPPQNVTKPMFGHGMSKGADIDYNHYNDLAIGAPNAETVYLYKTYPVIKVVAVAESLNREITIDQNKVQIKACWRIESSTRVNSDHKLKLKLRVDPQFKRVILSTGQSTVDFEVLAGTGQKCRFFDGTVEFSVADVFKPIDIQLHYDLVDKIPDSEIFCETCVALDPTDGKFVSSKIVFNTGCQNEVCVADLRLSSSGAKSPYVLGSSRTMTVTYEIRNAGEAAYLPQINITTSNKASFAKVPSICKLDDGILLCDLYSGRPMKQGNKDTLSVVIDTSNFDGNSMTIRAEVYSTGNESHPEDNILEDVIAFAEYSEIEFLGKAITPSINLEDGIYVAEMVNNFEIRNNGPSTIKTMEVMISIPISYLVPETYSRIPLVEASNISVSGMYGEKELEVVLTQNNTILIQNPVELTSTPPAIVDNIAKFDTGHISYSLERDYGYSLDDHTEHTSMMKRRRRDAKVIISDDEYTRVGRKQRTSMIADELANKLPVNRTIFFNCEDPEETLCIQASLTVHNVVPGDSFINITTRYHLDLKLVNKILSETRDIFVLTMSASISKIGDEKGTTIKVQTTLPHNIVSKHKIYSTPIWVIVLSVIGGLILLALLAYALYRFGFFRRQKKEELQKLKRESQRVTAEDTDDES